jgi:hypothetical protein
MQDDRLLLRFQEAGVEAAIRVEIRDAFIR